MKHTTPVWREEKRSIPLLCDARGIVWVPGFSVREEKSRKEKALSSPYPLQRSVRPALHRTGFPYLFDRLSWLIAGIRSFGFFIRFFSSATNCQRRRARPERRGADSVCSDPWRHQRRILYGAALFLERRLGQALESHHLQRGKASLPQSSLCRPCLL